MDDVIANPADKAPWPKYLALELVLQTAPIDKILEAQGVDKTDFITRISTDPRFVAEYKELAEQAKQEGFSYRMKARAQAEGMLTTTWNMVQNEKTPAAVRADLIKFTTRVAGLDIKDAEQAAPKDRVSITINLGMGAAPRVIQGETLTAAPKVTAVEEVGDHG